MHDGREDAFGLWSWCSPIQALDMTICFLSDIPIVIYSLAEHNRVLLNDLRVQDSSLVPTYFYEDGAEMERRFY